MEAGDMLPRTARNRIISAVRQVLEEIREFGDPHAETDHEAVRVSGLRLLGAPFHWEFMRRGGQSIVCLRCFYESFHPEDVTRAYCGHCHAFHRPHGGDEEELTTAAPFAMPRGVGAEEWPGGP